MASIENFPNADVGKVKNWDLLSAESKVLLSRQELLQKDRIQAINDGDENKRRLIEQELDEIAEKLK